MSTKIVIKTTDRVVPMIYAYTTPEIARHNGWTKIGYTEQDVDKRLSQQTHTADVEYKEEWRGNATFEDGSGDTFTDKDFHRYLRKLNIENDPKNEWFHVTGPVSRNHFYDFRANRGILREIVSDMTVDQILTNRKQMAVSVIENARPDLAKMGLEVVTFNVQDIRDAVDVQGHNHGVIEAIGIEQEELVKKQAEIARAQAARDVACAKADAEMAANAKEVEAQTAIAKRNNELQLAKAKLKAEADKAAADADAAGQIQMNLRAKEIKEAEADAEIAKQKKMVDLAAQEAEVQQRKLDAEVRKQADADLYRRQKEAEAKKYEAERAAEAQKFSKQQEAEGIELVGKAEAEAIRQKGLAEAEAMKQKAEAYKQYNDAAVAEMLIKVLPDIAKSVAQPLSSIDKVSIIGGDASGVSGVSGNVPILMAQTMQTVKEATGIDMGEIVRANSIQAKTDRNINIMTQCEQPENNKEKGGAKAMERVEGGYLIHEKSLNGEKVTHFRPDVTEEEKAIMKDKKAKD